MTQQFGIPGVNVSPETSGLSSLNVSGLFSVGGGTFLNLSTSTAVGMPGGNAYASFLVGAPFQIVSSEIICE